MGDNINVTRSGPEQMMDNEPPEFLKYHQMDRQISTRQSAAEIRALGLVGGIGLLLVLFVLWAFKTVTCWGLNVFTTTMGCTLASGLMWAAMFVVVAILAA